MHGVEIKLHGHLKPTMYELLQHISSDQDAIQVRVNQLVELEETCRGFFDQMFNSREIGKGTFDKREEHRMLEKGNLVLMWDKKREKPRKHEKFDTF